MKGKLALTKRGRLFLASVVMFAVVTTGLTVWWQTRQTVQAAVLNPHPGLVSWWRFDEGSGTAAGDSSGYGNSGKIYGATWVTGKYGGALSFDGTTNYVDCGNNPVLNLSIVTYMAWVKTSTTGIILTRANYDYFAIAPDGRVQARNYAGSVFSDSPVADGAWHHVAVTINLPTNTAIFYVDGLPNGARDISSWGGTWNYVKTWVGNRWDYPIPFNGALDEVRIYNKALSANEIQESFQKGPDFSSRLLAKTPKGTTQFITTVSWQGIGSINVTIQSPSQNYTEDLVPVYQKTVYSTSGGTSSMLNIKRLSVSFTALSSDENWYVALDFSNVEDYRITVEVQK